MVTDTEFRIPKSPNRLNPCLSVSSVIKLSESSIWWVFPDEDRGWLVEELLVASSVDR